MVERLRYRNLVVTTLIAALTVFAGAAAGLGPTMEGLQMASEDDGEDLETVEAGYSFGGSDIATGLDHRANLLFGQDIRGSRVIGDHVFAVGHSGLYVLNVSDPENPVEVGMDGCSGRDIAVAGDWAVVVIEAGACHGRTRGVAVFDISDPTDPRYEKGWTITAHTVAAYGDSGVFHIASQELTPHIIGPRTSSGYQDIIDTRSGTPERATRFHFPVQAENGDPVNAPSCHEIWFNTDIDRGYCAGIYETHIWDTTDPLAPKVLSVIKNPNISIHHAARTNADGTILIINDEEGGALVPACYFGGQGKVPRGALWFYDISDESLPVLQSWVSIPAPVQPTVQIETRCTSHYGEVLENDHQAVWAWYGGAVVIVDFSNILLPTVVDAAFTLRADTWGANLHDGYVFAGDMRRGFDIYRFTQ